MEKPTRISEQQRTDLVAYLDGELDENSADALERTLANSPVARHEVDMLTRTWELLDKLPQPNPSREFTVRTLTAIEIERTPLTSITSRGWYSHARRGAVIIGLLAFLSLGGICGYHVTHNLLPRKHARLIDDLDVIENLDAYSDVSDFAVLKELENQKVFDEDPEPQSP